MKGTDVDNGGKCSHRPDGLDQEKATHHDAITPTPLPDSVDQVLSLGFGLGPYVGRWHGIQQRSQSHKQGACRRLR